MKILIADDHAYNRDLLNFVLEDEGHECVHAENGEVAVEKFKAEDDIELILMDVNMPVMDGITATKQIRDEVGDRLVTIIFVTALDNSSVLVNCLDAGGDDFVPKPIDETILLSKAKAHARSQEMYNKLKNAHQELHYHKSLMDREHEIVEHVFNNGTNLAETECDNIHSYTSPMSMFNGDLVLTAPSPSGGVYTLVGDFTGHGLSAAIGCLPVTGIFYDFAARQASVGQIATAMNSRLRSILPINMFFCATITHLNPEGNELQIWSGGMNETLCLSPDGTKLNVIPADHMPLGILEDEEFDDDALMHEVEKGTRVYIYTDGINETKNSKDEEFGLERVEKLLLQNSENRIEKIIEAVHEFSGGGEFDDDVSMVEILCEPLRHRSGKDNEIVDVGAAYRNAECFPWNLSLNLTAADLKRTDTVHQILEFLGTIEGIELHQDKLFTILSELYSNSLEHGVLGLQSSIKSSPEGFETYYRLRQERLDALTDDNIKIEMSYHRDQNNRIELKITDSGDGFDYTSISQEIGKNEERHGRGLHLLKTLCSKLEYSNGGRTVTAHYQFT